MVTPTHQYQSFRAFALLIMEVKCASYHSITEVSEFKELNGGVPGSRGFGIIFHNLGLM